MILPVMIFYHSIHEQRKAC